MAFNNQTEKTALVTGGTDGIGKEIALGLGRAGNRVIIVGRDGAKGARAVKEIIDAAGNPNVEYSQADLSLLCEVSRLSKEIAVKYPALHYLVLGAGVVRGRLQLTSEGVESNF